MIENLTRTEYNTLLRQDFSTFAARCFHDLNPQAELAMNWHLEVIAAKLTAVRQGKIQRLIINLPPRHLKSLMASIAFPAWCLGHDPSAQILCVSYAQDLADKLARDCRSIMMSRWYRGIFPTRLAAHRQAVQEFITTAQGYRLATSNGGVLTGRGADIILIDDPLKPEEALSDAQRQAANEWYDHTLYSRQNDKRRGAIVVIMQRLHEDDPVGHVLAQEPWEVLSFPAIAEADEAHEIETIWGPRCFSRRQGEALHPGRETRSEVVKNGVLVKTQLAQGLPLIQGDRVQLQQVILNLIINAVEAMSAAGEGSRELLISTGKAESDGVLVAVRDSGPGLAPASFQRLFEAFYTTKPGGLRMGLSICRSIIEAHRGRLWATANVPQGAVFQFTVSAHPGSAP
jgi:hypothetical protein